MVRTCDDCFVSWEAQVRKRCKDGKTRCKSCRTILAASKWNKKNPEKVQKIRRVRDLRDLYGLTIEDFEKMKVQQNNQCAICKEQTELEIDHSHITNKVRGLLCGVCNKALGAFKDNIKNLEQAINYLKE